MNESQPLLYKRVRLLHNVQLHNGITLKCGRELTVGVQQGNRLALYDHTKACERDSSRWIVMNARIQDVEPSGFQPHTQAELDGE